MKKKLLLLPAIALMLGSCTLIPNPSPTPDPGPTPDPDPTEWSTEVSESMSYFLYGEVLPFAYIKNAEYGYDTVNEYWYIDGQRGNSYTPKTYAKNYKEEDGWKGGDVSESENGSEYAFTKKVATDDGDRYLQVYFYAYNTTGTPSSLGKNFFISAYDPYVYEFPTDKALEYISTYTDKSDPYVPPVYLAEFYAYSDEYCAIYSEVTSETDDYGYSAVLEIAGWDVLEEKDSYGYYVAVAPDETYQVSYLYEEDEGIFFLYFEQYIKKYEGWPAASFIDEKLGSNVALPTPVTEVTFNSKYYFIPAYEYLIWGVFPVSIPDAVYIDVDKDIAEAYVNQLSNAGWDVSESDGDYTAIDENNKIVVMFSYSESDEATSFVIYRFEDVYGKLGYPTAEEVEEVLGVANFDFPEVDVGGAEVLVTHKVEVDDDEAEYFEICVDGFNGAAVYADQLEDLGWTVNDGVDSNGDTYYWATNSDNAIILEFSDYADYSTYEPATYIYAYLPVYED